MRYVWVAPAGGQGPVYAEAPVPLTATAAPWGTSPSARLVRSAGRPVIAQWANGASWSIIVTAISCVPAGAGDQVSAGDTLAPLHV